MQYEIAYGKDHMFGLFIQVFDRNKLVTADDDSEALLVDKDEFRDPSFNKERLIEIAEDYGFIIE